VRERHTNKPELEMPASLGLYLQMPILHSTSADWQQLFN